MHDVDVDALEVLINYAYTAEVEISESNVQVLCCPYTYKYMLHSLYYTRNFRAWYIYAYCASVPITRILLLFGDIFLIVISATITIKQSFFLKM